MVLTVASDVEQDEDKEGIDSEAVEVTEVLPIEVELSEVVVEDRLEDKVEDVRAVVVGSALWVV